MDIFELFKRVSEPKVTGSPEYIVAGLGNPGAKYENTRHNAGFMAVDTIAAKHTAQLKKLEFKSLTGMAEISGHKVLLMKPTTFMNNSGEAVTAAMQYYKIPIERVIVINDDISLEPSQLRIRRKGSDGGHNGLKSIIYLTGSDGFTRIKLGVGKKPPQFDLADWVLSCFSKDEIKLMHESTDKAASAVELILNGETDKAMNLFNS